MNDPDTRSFAEKELCYIIQGIALSIEEQASVYEGICIHHALSGRFDHCSGKVLRARSKKATPEVRSALEELKRILDGVCGDPARECSSIAFLQGSQLWKDSREKAIQVLDSFGWPRETPPRSSVARETTAEVDVVPPSMSPLPRGFKRWTGGDPILRFHGPLFEMLNLQPVVSKPFERIILEREKAFGRSFPASVVELLQLRGIFGLFAVNSAGCCLIGFEADDRSTLRKLGDPEWVEDGHHLISIANQGVTACYVRLDGSEDPPVFSDGGGTAYETEDSDADQPGPIAWQPVARTFSEFVFDAMTDWRFQTGGHRLQLEALDVEPGPADFKRLANNFRTGPGSREWGLFAHRYFTTHGIIRISNDPTYGPIPEGQATWHIEADSPEALARIFQGVAAIGTLRTSLKLDAEPNDLGARAEELLDR
ncbi:hypothetical protein P12x_000772 [Tundrisphaera lichenicola]|uniref:hypothetical protein n=1 Tax=Tundrisphaera lichenicola TaxID=2029860 RepID=UPI003EBC735A